MGATRQTVAERRAYSREYMRRRKAAGICLRCPGRAAEDGPVCVGCRVKMKKRTRGA